MSIAGTQKSKGRTLQKLQVKVIAGCRDFDVSHSVDLTFSNPAWFRRPVLMWLSCAEKSKICKAAEGENVSGDHSCEWVRRKGTAHSSARQTGCCLLGVRRREDRVTRNKQSAIERGERV